MGWNHMRDFKIEQGRSMSSIWNHKYDFRPKLPNTRFMLLHPFWNRQSTGLGQFNAVLSWFEIKFIHFWGGKIRLLETKVAKFASWYSSFIFLFPAIWLVIFSKPWNLIGCFVFSVASSLAGKKMWFKTKNGVIQE